MKVSLFLLCCSASLWCGTDPAGVRAVYVMPMSRGMDQFLANRLAGEKLFRVVSDPKMADLVFTDRIGEALNASLDDFVPKAEPPAEAADDAGKGADAKKSGDAKTEAETPMNKLDNPSWSSSFSRGKGTFFLVDAKSRVVVWSTFVPPKSSAASQMDRTASDIVSRLKHELKKP